MKFLDLEAQVDSDNEFGSKDENERLEHEKFLDNSPFDEDISFSGEPLPSSSFTNIESCLDHVVEHIEDKYLKQSVVEGDDDLPPLEVLVLEADAWPLWRVKCTGPQSLQQILRGFSDVRMSSLALVSQSDIQKCLQIPTTRDRVMVGGQWVQINRGLYRGDVGLVVNHYHNKNSVNSVQVLLVPRLGFSSAPSSSLKRKHINPRPPPQLFDLQKCNPEEGQIIVHETNEQIYTFKSYRFEYGLQMKTYNPHSLSVACKLPPETCKLFVQSKELGGARFDLIDIWSMPVPSFWRFEPGECVLVHRNQGVEKGVISVSLGQSTLTQSYVVDLVGQGEHIVRIIDITKNIVLGDFVEVLAGNYAGQTGSVVARVDTLLGICVGPLKLAEPDYANPEIPWLNIQVKLLSAPYTGQTGLVKDVTVTSQRSLSITVELLDGSTCIVGYSELREQSSGKLLLDYQPLKKHQQQFDVEVPWKECEVLIMSGCFSSCLIEIDHSAVVELRTRLPLLEYRPLEGIQLLEFKPNTALQDMQTGPCPWLGMLVDIVKGPFKGHYGAVRDVNRHAEAQSGIMLTVERYVITAGSSVVVKVDYNAVRYHKVHVPFNTVVPSRQRPKPSTEKGLMVIAQNHPQHIGKLVRQVHHFYKKDKIEQNHLFVLVTVERSGSLKRQGSEFLELHADDLDYVKESAEERKYLKQLLQTLRMELASLGVCVQDKQDFFTVSPLNVVQ
ncbi:hypothetical protein BDP27DRAFT_1433143 [Rhodocollybia butyracea]|uniref:KOW domain-containing protein n=1 Tax=Rhodocollybia butyracea TaxID=206335 RepID=A0A9P5P7A0_9AGAR|nr:hypothetical protein BDP27DRAFT_1433143 [Rhodocollybia butyracea]